MNFAVNMFSSRLQLTSFPALFFTFDESLSAENATESKHWLARMNSQGCQTFFYMCHLASHICAHI